MAEQTKEIYDIQGAGVYDYYGNYYQKRQTTVMYEQTYNGRIPSYESMWYNCTETYGDCTYSSVYYNDYTGSIYTLTKNREEQSDTYVLGDKRELVTTKATGVILSILLTIGLCIPICSFCFMTRKRVYKDAGPVAEAQEGIRVEWEDNNAINADGDVSA